MVTRSMKHLPVDLIVVRFQGGGGHALIRLTSRVRWKALKRMRDLQLLWPANPCQHEY
jgi:hypothetical protein